jgi:hypothetical protein
MSNSINVNRIATPSIQGGAVPLPGRGEDAKKNGDKYKPVTEHTTVKRVIPVTDYVPPGADEEPESPAAVAPATDTPAVQDRRARWEASQKAKREARQQAAIDEAKKNEPLAREALRRGDLAAVAKALNMTVPEYLAYTNQGALGIKPEVDKPKELTPAEQFEADKAKFSKDMADFRAEQAAERNQRAMSSFIEKDIRPVLADKDAYEMIHATGAADIETYAYRYMNEHYVKTSERDEAGNITKPGEILNAKDVLDTIEENLVKAAEATAAALKSRKKLAKHFAAPNAEAATEEAAEPEEPAVTAINAARRARIEAARKAMEADEELTAEPAQLGAAESAIIDPEPAKVVKPGGANVRALRGVKLTPAQRVEAARQEEEEARKKLFGKR